MARNGMSAIIARLRAMTATGTADYTVAATTYWTDDQLQAILDQHRRTITRKALTPESVIDGGTHKYYDYYYDSQWVEGTASGTAVWRIEDAAGSTIAGTLYATAPDARLITFTYNTLGSAYYLSTREYDLERAAADVWRQKAADVAVRFDVVIDNHDLKRHQLYESYMAQAKYYAGQAKPTMTRLKRVDVN